MAVPSYSIGGLRIESRSRSSWGTSYLHDRLHRERSRLKIMLWPFQILLDYPAFKDMKKKPPPLHVRLDALENEPALQAEVHNALEEARRQEVTLLILPELSIPPATLWEAASGRAFNTLAGHESSVFSVAWSPDGQRLASGSDDGTVRLWGGGFG
jgi:hypothetical protein